MKFALAVISCIVLAAAMFASGSGIAYAIGVEVRKTVSARVVVTPQPAPAIAGDVDGNGTVNLTDLGLVVSNFNSMASGFTPADINQDGLVDIFDLVKVGINFGRTRD